MNKRTEYVFTNAVSDSCDSIGVYTLYGYSDDDCMYDSVEFSYIKIADILKGLRKDNKYDIEIRDVYIGADRKYTARIYVIPYRISCRELCSESELYELRREAAVTVEIRAISSRVNSGCFSMGPRLTSSIIRLYVIQHYARDGRDVFYYDRKGNKSGPYGDIYYSAYKQAEDGRLRHALYDGCASVQMIYKDVREIGGINK